MAKKEKSKPKFINPFTKGVTYEQFLNALPKDKTVAEYLKGKCTDEQIQWLENEIKQFKKQ